MKTAGGPDADFIREYMRLKPLYSGAQKTVCAKFEILDDEFSMLQGHDPIHHIESRLKTVESAYEKLKRRGYEQIPENLSKLSDIAGVRVVCGYIEDIYKIARVFVNQTGVRLLQEKDYIKNPKPNGYRSLHLIAEIPVSLSVFQMGVPVEIRFGQFPEYVGESRTRSFLQGERRPGGLFPERIEELCGRFVRR